ncbi:MAG: DUF4965 domain-containing protein [Armatimonadetes bacterium]|nr:DUF4965 domain-containing protein [Armatimonadota bacterium]
MLNIATALVAASLSQNGFRPPAVPLVTHDPYFSLWSRTDALTDGPVSHWTGTPQPIRSMVRVDGKAFRIMGAAPADLPAMTQTSVGVYPTRTVYRFEGGGIEVLLKFTTPMLPDDLDLFSRPASYISWTVRSLDGASHKVSVYFDASPVIAVNEPSQQVEWSKTQVGKLNLLRISSVDQPTLQKRGDNLRIDWGHLLIGTSGDAAIAAAPAKSFAETGMVGKTEPSKPTNAGKAPLAAISLSMGTIGKNRKTSHIVFGYDDEYSIQLMQNNLRPYWRRNGLDGNRMMALAEQEYAANVSKCEKFDSQLLADLVKTGGENYGRLGSLAYRQSFAAQKVVADANGQPLMFSKENFSNGCIATVDVLYPAAPQMLFFSPTLTKASLTPLMEYASSPRWKFPFAPHDMGTYPKANGQVYGGGEFTEDNQMPVEETGNMIILLAALAKVEGNAEYSAKYWPVLTRWAKYLASKGFDPERQLCTDDFAGHLGHNVNLSIKAIVGLDSFAYLADKLGKKSEAATYHKLAKEFADRWVKEAKEGDHYRLAFDQPNTWSQKYNLVWDRLLGLNLFPSSVATEEMAYYRTKMHGYGLPLDNRRDYTKLDWEIWTATLTGKRDDFETILDPVIAFLNETPDRNPMSDWYDTVNAKQQGFQARSVVGGVFIKMLDTPFWKKYAARDKDTAKDWAKLPVPPKLTPILPISTQKAVDWRYVDATPGDGWSNAVFDDSNWNVAPAGFGEGDNRGGQIRTPWKTKDIWMRTTFDLGKVSAENVRLILAHDDGAEVYINGVLAVHAPGAAGYDTYQLPKTVIASLKATGNVIAVHVHDDGGDRYADAGIAAVSK